MKICDRDHVVIETTNGVHKIVGDTLYNKFEADKIVYDKRYSKQAKKTWTTFGGNTETPTTWSVYCVSSIKTVAPHLDAGILTQIEKLKR